MILLWSLRDLLLLLFAAVVLAMALCTLVGILRERRPMQRPLALALCIFGLLLLVAGAAGVVVPPFLEEFSLLLQKLPEAGQTLVRMGVDWIDTISEAIYGANAFPDIDELELNGPRQLVPNGTSLAAGRSVAGTARILQLSFDPAKRLLGQVFNVGGVSLAKQLHQCRRQQLGTTPLSVALQLMPVAIANAEQLMQLLRLVFGGLGPWSGGRCHPLISRSI